MKKILLFFQAVIVYLKLETAALQKVKESQSRTASLNKDKKKQEISAVFKFFIRAADKRNQIFQMLFIDKEKNKSRKCFIYWCIQHI